MKPDLLTAHTNLTVSHYFVGTTKNPIEATDKLTDENMDIEFVGDPSLASDFASIGIIRRNAFQSRQTFLLHNPRFKPQFQPKG